MRLPWTTGLLDLILFDNSITVNGSLYESMFWYSDEGSGNQADTLSQFSASALNTILSSSDAALQDVTENWSGLATYTPTSQSDPGYINGSGSTVKQYTYDFQSSVAPVPEPATVLAGVLLLLPLGISTIRVLRRKNTVADKS